MLVMLASTLQNFGPSDRKKEPELCNSLLPNRFTLQYNVKIFQLLELSDDARYIRNISTD